MSSILVINSGSSSFKYQLIDMATETATASGLIERIGEDGAIPDHAAGFKRMLETFEAHGPSLADADLVAVGHRVVHGGARFFEPTLITELVKINIQDLSELAPLHNPGALQGIEAAQRTFPNVPHVAVFDTAFHQSMPPAAYTYAIDAEVAARYRIRRYGFHGTSYKYVSQAVADFLERPITELKQIVLHLGNGASACAIDGGRSIETSMGLTPLAGLVMGTRSGDIDPSVLIHLGRRAGYSIDDLDDLLNQHSGLLGLSGHSDSRDVARLADEGDPAASLAAHTFRHRVKFFVGAYIALLGGVDAITFTAGIGEHNAGVRQESLGDLEALGIEVDRERNYADAHGARRISTDASRVAVLVVPTNEELEIARQSLGLISG